MNLIDDYKKFCEYRENYAACGKLDLSSERFIFPTTLLPIYNLIIRNNPKVIPPVDRDVSKYLEIVTNGSRYRIAERMKKSYLPVVTLPEEKAQADTILNRLNEMHNNGEEFGGEQAFNYLLGEIVDNIYEHSEFGTSIVMAQIYPSYEFMDVSFFDNGITINGSFSNHNMRRESDVQAIEDAVNGTSTKSQERGYGLNTVTRIFTEGMNGQILVISGEGGIEYYEDAVRKFPLEKPYELLGTLVTVRAPYPSSGVDIYDYVE